MYNVEINQHDDMYMCATQKWKCDPIDVGDASYNLYHTDIVNAAAHIFESPQFSEILNLESKIKVDKNGDRLYSDINSGTWWQEEQVCMM